MRWALTQYLIGFFSAPIVLDSLSKPMRDIGRGLCQTKRLASEQRHWP